jgi:predicted secreted hydrolase
MAWSALVLVLAGACTPEAPRETGMSAGGRLSGDTTGYRQVTEPRAFEFPADHGAHPRYKHEWWYVTGQAATTAGRRFGFQFTIFREAIAPEPPRSASRWATSQLYLAHAAVTDVQSGRYLSDERFARGALGLAGAEASPFEVWLEDWRLRGSPDGSRLDARMTANSGEFGLDLEIGSTRPPVAHGRDGMSIKGAEGNASHYYSYTRMDTRGTIRVGDESFEVTGSSWLDHEWSSSALAADQSGWDWFSLQLSGGRDLMVFRLRHRTDAGLDFYSGTYVDASGDPTSLEGERIELKALGHWTSTRTGMRYPVRWRLVVPELDLAVTITPLIENQEFAHGFRYWEGAVAAVGRQAGEEISGRGYVELTGYTADDGR